MTTNITNQYCGNGIYTISSSSQKPGTAVDAFDGDRFGCWITSNTYQTSVYPNSYQGSVVTSASGTQLRGEWIQIDLPTRIKPVTYTINSCAANQLIGQKPLSWALLGSNKKDWVLLDREEENASWSQAIQITMDANVTSFKSFRLVILESQQSNSEAVVPISIGEIRIEGIRG